MLVVVKPPGIPSQKTPTGEAGMEERLRAFLQARTGKNPFLAPVHRLDRRVGGLLLFARRSKALSRLHAALREGRMEKVYRGVVARRPPQDKALLEHKLVHGDHKAYEGPTGKPSLLSYELLGPHPEGWLLEIRLHTGRYHQIRAQLSAIGCPLVGDPKYGGPPAPELLLTHTRLSFNHPMTGELLVIEI